jgi:hypothetical protein
MAGPQVRERDLAEHGQQLMAQVRLIARHRRGSRPGPAGQPVLQPPSGGQYRPAVGRRRRGYAVERGQGGITVRVAAPDLAERSEEILRAVFGRCVLLCDTGVLLAAGNVRDHAHEACIALLSSADGPLLVPTPVLGEVG